MRHDHSIILLAAGNPRGARRDKADRADLTEAAFLPTAGTDRTRRRQRPQSSWRARAPSAL